METNEHVANEALVAQTVAMTAAHPPLQSSAEPVPVPPALHRTTSQLSMDHMLNGELADRHRGFRAWWKEMKNHAQSNYFGIRQRMKVAKVAYELRQASPSEQRDLLQSIESAFGDKNVKDVHVIAALYTIVCSNYELPEFRTAHLRACRLLEGLDAVDLGRVRDIIDHTAEGRGFLPLVLTGGMEHYKSLSFVLSQCFHLFAPADFFSLQKFSTNLTMGYTAPRRSLKIFSDIDDTVIANWVDLKENSLYRWEPKTVYPDGVDLIFLSARPLKHQLQTIDALRGYGFGVPSPGNFTVLYGEFIHNLTPNLMGVFKFHMHLLYAGLYPHMDFVFFGDSGQGDFRCAELMLNRPPLGTSRLRAAFMHEIRPSNRQFRQVSLETPDSHLHYFYHYGQAADQALREGLITQDGRSAVIESFVHESKQLAESRLGDPDSILATFHTQPATDKGAQLDQADILPEQGKGSNANTA